MIGGYVCVSRGSRGIFWSRIMWLCCTRVLRSRGSVIGSCGGFILISVGWERVAGDGHGCELKITRSKLVKEEGDKIDGVREVLLDRVEGVS